LPDVDRRYFEKLSGKTGFQRDTLEKVYRLGMLLKEVVGDEYLRDHLVLKGGTAINLIFFDLPRLSVDIDMNYTALRDREGMLKDKEALHSIFQKIFMARGYEMEAKKPHALLQYELKYTNTSGNIDRIKMEINFMERIPVTGVVEKTLNLFDESIKVRTYPIEELFATKFRALATRGAPRDLFDAYMLITSGLDYDRTLLKKCFIFYTCLAEDFRKFGAGIVEEIDERSMKRFLLPLLHKGAQPDLDGMKGLVGEYLSSLFELTKGEVDFINLFYGESKADLESLFEGVKYNPDLNNHPMMKWKLGQTSD
jgi:predicted nucleotidyltransferase component of viral defense system